MLTPTYNTHTHTHTQTKQERNQELRNVGERMKQVR
jgi:hypothetical protein